MLDEPTVGLHPQDTQGMIDVLKQLRDNGNTVLVIEHDPDVMRAADHIIDIGPGAGRHGGQVVGSGTLEELAAQPGFCHGRLVGEASAAKADASGGDGRRGEDKERLPAQSAKCGCGISGPLSFCGDGGVGSGKSSLVFGVLADERNSVHMLRAGTFQPCGGY